MKYVIFSLIEKRRDSFKKLCLFLALFITLFAPFLGHTRVSPQNVRLIEWQPTPDHPTFILPALSNETPEQAVFHYLYTVIQDLDIFTEGPQLSDVISKDQISPHIYGSLTRDASLFFLKDVISNKINFKTPNEWRLEEFHSQGETPTLLVANRSEDHIANDPRINEMTAPFLERGLTPYLLPVGASLRLQNPYSFHKSLAQSFPGLVLLGGADIDPQIYRRVNRGSIKTNKLRDNIEIELLKDFAKQKLGFILAICRGAQLVNVAYGGKMVQNIQSQVKHGKGENGEVTLHNIRLLKFGLLSQALKETDLSQVDKWMVNSYHHQGQLLKVGGLIKASAVAPDGTVEAIEVDNFILGLQSHPEREDPSGFGKLVLDFAANQIRVAYSKFSTCNAALQAVN